MHGFIDVTTTIMHPKRYKSIIVLDNFIVPATGSKLVDGEHKAKLEVYVKGKNKDILGLKDTDYSLSYLISEDQGLLLIETNRYKNITVINTKGRKRSLKSLTSGGYTISNDNEGNYDIFRYSLNSPYSPVPKTKIQIAKFNANLDSLSFWNGGWN